MGRITVWVLPRHELLVASAASIIEVSAENSKHCYGELMSMASMSWRGQYLVNQHDRMKSGGVFSARNKYEAQ